MAKARVPQAAPAPSVNAKSKTAPNNDTFDHSRGSPSARPRCSVSATAYGRNKRNAARRTTYWTAI